MKKFHPAYSAAFLIVGSGALISRGRYSSYGPIDTAILVLFLIFFWWLISDFSGEKPMLMLTDVRVLTVASLFGSASF